MKLYNINTDRVEEVKLFNLKIAGNKSINMHTSRATGSQLKTAGLYRIQIKDKPDQRYYLSTPVNSVLSDRYVKDFTSRELPISTIQGRMKKKLKEYKEKKQNSRPVVDTSLGYSVDGGYRDLQNLNAARSLKLNFCLDVDGVSHFVFESDWDVIIRSVELNGLNIININRTKKEEINALSTLDECKLYEATPKIKNVEILDKENGTGTGVFKDLEIVVNTITDW